MSATFSGLFGDLSALDSNDRARAVRKKCEEMEGKIKGVPAPGLYVVG
jgi:hypothetical protein